MSLIRKLDPRHWRAIRRTFDSIRATYFSKDPRPTQLRLDTDIETLRKKLGRAHFTNAWELSYHYEGEDLNMRRPEWRDDKYNWYQLHLRGFERDGAVEIHAHYELEPTENPYGHIEGINFEFGTGIEMATELFDDLDIPYERIQK